MNLKLTIYLCLLLTIVFSGCFVSREQEPEEGVAEFGSWVQAHANRLEHITEEDWQRAREDFEFRTQVLDKKLEELDRESLQVYEQHKDQFRELDNEFKQITEQRKLIAPWKDELLGSYGDMEVINQSNVADVYRFFLSNVREKYAEWNENAWNMASMVLQELNKRKSQLDADLPSEDEVKIKALQMEFAAIEAAESVEN